VVWLDIFRGRTGTPILVALIAACVCILGYEIYVYSQRTGKAYRWLFVSQAQEEEISYLRVLIVGGKPEKVTRVGEGRDIADSLTYRPQRAVGQAVVRVNAERSFDLYFQGERNKKATVIIRLVDRGREAAQQTVTASFLHRPLDVLRRTKHGCLRVGVTAENQLVVAALEGVQITPATQAPADEEGQNASGPE